MFSDLEQVPHPFLALPTVTFSGSNSLGPSVFIELRETKALHFTLGGVWPLQVRIHCAAWFLHSNGNKDTKKSNQE